jgi:hypothetical protein
MEGLACRSLVRHTSVCLLILAMAFVGINVGLPTAIPPAHGQTIGVVAGTILGLVVIAGIVYLISRDRYGVYHRYPYGQYYAAGYGPSHVHYTYTGPYSGRYRAYEGRWYRGPMPRSWSGDRGCSSGRFNSGRCM